MSTQVRTWEKTTDPETGRQRWDVSINGVKVPGGYVIETSDGQFEAHYPHIVPFLKPTLEQAKERLEWAPPVTYGVARIAREVDTDQLGFVDLAKAADKLGISEARVRAMVADGKIAAKRGKNGEALASLTSLDELENTTNSAKERPF
jgi:hypothetical protein